MAADLALDRSPSAAPAARRGIPAASKLAAALVLTGGTLLGAMAAAGCAGASDPAAAKGPLFEKITLAGQTYSLELARDDKSREKGLGGRASIPDDGGMLFVFPDSAVRNFWMYDCTIDIDVIYVDPLGFVTAVHTMPAEAPRGKGESVDEYRARLKRYSSVSPAMFAIEIKPGDAKRLGIKPNDKIAADWARIRKLAK